MTMNYIITSLTNNLSIAKIIFITSIIILIIGILIIELIHSNSNKLSNIIFYLTTSIIAVISFYYIKKDYNINKFKNDIHDDSKLQMLFQYVKDIMWNPQDPDYLDYINYMKQDFQTQNELDNKKKEYIQYVYNKVCERSNYNPSILLYYKSSVVYLINDYIQTKLKGYTYPHSLTFIDDTLQIIYQIIDNHIQNEVNKPSDETKYLGTSTIYNDIGLHYWSPEAKEIYNINEDIIKDYIDNNKYNSQWLDVVNSTGPYSIFKPT